MRSNNRRRRTLSTAVERKTRKAMIFRPRDLTARAKARSTIRRYQALPPEARRTMTYDNGNEQIISKVVTLKHQKFLSTGCACKLNAGNADFSKSLGIKMTIRGFTGFRVIILMIVLCRPKGGSVFKFGLYRISFFIENIDQFLSNFILCFIGIKDN